MYTYFFTHIHSCVRKRLKSHTLLVDDESFAKKISYRFASLSSQKRIVKTTVKVYRAEFYLY